MIGLTLYTFVTMVGGNPLKDKYGFRFWKTPGPFGVGSGLEVLRGVFDTVIWSCFAYVPLNNFAFKHWHSVWSDPITSQWCLVKSRTLDESYLQHSTLSFTESYSSTSPEHFASVSSLHPMIQTSLVLLRMVPQEPPNLLTSSVRLVPFVDVTKRWLNSNEPTPDPFPPFFNQRPYFGLDLLNYQLVRFHRIKGHVRYVPKRSSSQDLGSSQQTWCSMGISPLCPSHRMSLLPLNLIHCCQIPRLVDLFGRVCSIDQLGRYWIVSHTTCPTSSENTLIVSIYLRFRHGLKVQNLLKTDILPVKGRLQPLSGWWLVIWAPIIFIFKWVPHLWYI